MNEKLSSVLTFASGIAVGAFTNVFTGLAPDYLAIRITAAVAFLAAGVLLYWSATQAEQAITYARRVSVGAGDLDSQFRDRFGTKGLLSVASGLICGVVAVVALIFAVWLKSQGCQP